MTYAYLVTGSEDGPIGIYSNKDRAISAATGYVKQDGRQAMPPEHLSKWYITIRRVGISTQVYADVQRFYLN